MSEKTSAAAQGAASVSPTPHDADLVVVRVIFKGGVNSSRPDHLEDGRPYRYGDTFTTTRGHAKAQAHALQIIATAEFRNAPGFVAQNDPGVEPGPVDVGPRQS